MTAIMVSTIVCACMLGGLIIGMWLASLLPAHHLNSDSKDAIKLGMGMIATVTALVLGLVTASAKSEYDADDTAVKHGAASILTLDRMLARYGPETKDIREHLKSAVSFRLNVTWPEEGAHATKVDTAERTLVLEQLENGLRKLVPKTDDQKWFQSRALDISSELLQTRWLLFGGKGSSIPLPFLIVVIFWLTMLFGSFGLFAPRNATVFIVMFVCAISVAASVFLILEMEQPFEGMMKVSSEPLRYTLSHLDE